MGRPPSTNPKSKSIPIRLDAATEKILQDYCDKHNSNRAEAIREAIHRLNEDESRYFWSPEWRQLLGDNEKNITNISEEFQGMLNMLLQTIQQMKTKTGSESNESD
ncbi:ribbon-helix-helix protein, CopG family [Paenibacillus sp. 19GGS1-52]|uniref:hypothetical protein n=1 Tax=Paenibacillus sp. 19GGS1-52 TaxID=2758563 RepID=UPI001EFBEFD5|nr:hypothetical protein [Paenibacillus sp. 19GGS1-52]ULO07127.1 ribbon-helix-helix protein, CopG family [Paenibacillus sp. 19GGS1-52]